MIRISEDELAIQIADGLRASYPGLLWFHIANEAGLKKRKGKDGKWYSPEGVKRKKMGVRAGVLDLQFIGDDGRCYFIELKAPKDGAVSDEQAQFMGDLRQRKVPHAICRSWEQVQGTLQGWGLVPHETKGAAA